MVFYINGTNWRVVFVKPNSEAIRRTDGSYSVGTTDANTHEIYLNENLHGDFLKKVFIHEVCHAICISYEIYLPIEQEELLCDFVATYGKEVLDIVEMMLGAVRMVS